MLDLILTNKEGPVRSIKVKGSLGSSDHKIMDPERRKTSKKQDHHPGLQDSRI